MVTFDGEASLAALIGDLLTGEVVVGTREPGKWLAHDPEVASSSNTIACSVYQINYNMYVYIYISY